MDKKDTIVTDLVIQTLRLNDSLKQRDVQLERLTSENRELRKALTKLKGILSQYVPDIAKQIELFRI